MSIKEAPLNKIQEAYQILIKEAIRTQSHRSCLNCISWGGPAREFCYKWNEKPPAGVIVLSCGDHWEGDIPF